MVCRHYFYVRSSTGSSVARTCLFTLRGSHVEHLATGTPVEIREHDADRFAARGRLWR
jgi:hypothetical protein